MARRALSLFSSRQLTLLTALPPAGVPTLLTRRKCLTAPCLRGREIVQTTIRSTALSGEQTNNAVEKRRVGQSGWEAEGPVPQARATGQQRGAGRDSVLCGPVVGAGWPGGRGRPAIEAIPDRWRRGVL